MKKSSFFLFVMLAALLAFGIALAGCGGSAGEYPGELKLAQDSLGTAGNGEITGLSAGKGYIVHDGKSWYAINAIGTLKAGKQTEAAAIADLGATTLIGIKITGLNNFNTYRVVAFIQSTSSNREVTINNATDNTIVSLPSNLADDDFITFGTGNAGSITLLLNGNLTNCSLNNGAAIADGATITTSNGITYTFSAVTAGSATIAYKKGEPSVTFNDYESTTTTFKLTLSH